MMLKRIYINNYRCLVNFELELEAVNLLLGLNGTGKSAVFEVLQKIQGLIVGRCIVDNAFGPDDKTQWITSLVQDFELEIQAKGGMYKYELTLEHHPEMITAGIQQERLWFDGHLLFELKDGEVQIYRDDYSELYKYEWRLANSVLTMVGGRTDSQKIDGFKESVKNIVIAKLKPNSIQDYSNRVDSYLYPDASNFISWYFYLSQDQRKILRINQQLGEIFEDFSHFKFEQLGRNARTLTVVFKSNSGESQYEFERLSDGQRALIILYSILIFLEGNENTLLCIDEPDNFVALPEIQPWLMQLYDLCGQQKSQAVLISHNSEIMNQFTETASYWFERKNQSSPVRVRKIAAILQDKDKALTLSELVANGWLNDEA